MAGVITAAQVEVWFDRSCSLVDDWETWYNVWQVDGLNDTDPPDPPMPPTTPAIRKALFCEAIAEAYEGSVPAGWPY